MKKGFTLIELLIVIAIIGILAVAFLPSMMNAPMKARDTARIADVENITQKIAAKDIAGTAVSASGCVAGPATGGAGLTAPTGLAATDFERGWPKDPQNSTTVGTCTGYYVFYKAGATNYRYLVVAKVEDTSKGNMACPAGAFDIDTAGFGATGACYAVGLK